MSDNRRNGLVIAGWVALLLIIVMILGAGVAITSPGDCAGGRFCLFLPKVATLGEAGRSPIPADSPTSRPTAKLAPTPTDGPPSAPSSAPGPGPRPLTGLAILGDSTQDEYRTDNPRGGEYNATTLNWVELLASVRGINVGPPGTFDEPRRSGYAYNWARSGATTGSMLNAGQHNGVAQQIATGNVSHVLIQIGINDFNQDDLAVKIALGQIGDSELKTTLDNMAANVEVAIHTLRQGGEAGILLAAMQDYASADLSPEAHFNDPAAIQRVTDAIAYYNQQLAAVAARQGVPYFDFNAALQADLAARVDAENFLAIDGERIDLNTRGNEPHHGLLDDTYYHPGTVLSALFANVYIREMNRVFGTSILPLTDEEILRAAGIRMQPTHQSG